MTSYNEIYARIAPCEKYDIEINGVKYPDCKLEGTWEGLAKFKTKAGDTVIVDWGSGSVDEFMQGLFQTSETKKCLVVKISPSMMANIMKEGFSK